MSDQLHVLAELGRELERVAPGARAGTRGRPFSRAPRRLVVLVAALALATAAVAAAAVLLIREGSPLPAPHPQDLSASGIPLAGSARLAGLDAADPEGGVPPWDLRLSRTDNGEICVAVGQVVRGVFGIVGLDGVFRPIPLGGVDACSVPAPGVPVLAGARTFFGRTSADARTVVSGVAGRDARAVTVYGTGAPRSLELGPGGSFITVYAGMPEGVRPRIAISFRDGQHRSLAIEQSTSAEVSDPDGGAPWRVSSEPDLQQNAYPDESCAQATQQPDQEHPSPGMRPLTPELCGRLSERPLFVVMRRFVPGTGTGSSFPWGQEPARTMVYGIADPRVSSLSLSGAGASRTVTIQRHGGAFLAVLDGHVDPRSLTLTARLADGATHAYHGSTPLFDANTNRPVTEPAVPAYAEPQPAARQQLPPFELEIPQTARETLRATDPVNGRTWVLRSWRGMPNTHVGGVQRSRGDFLCVALGLSDHGRLVEPSAVPSPSSASVTPEDGRCNQLPDIERMRYMLQMESFVADAFAYVPKPGRVVLSGMLPSGASHAVLLGLGAPRRLRLDSNDAFLLVLPGRFWRASPHISYTLRGRRFGRAAGPSFPFGTAPRRPQSRAPDPDGSAPWGFAATADCHTATGRIVEGSLTSLDERTGVLKTGPSETSWSSQCLTHGRSRLPAPIARQPVEFDVQPTETYAGVPGGAGGLTQPEIERRSLPGRTLITGVALPGVSSVTITTPTDVRTLRPSGPLHTLIAVYAGSFLGGRITATVGMRNGRSVTEQIFAPGTPPPEAVSGATGAGRLAAARRQMSEVRASAAHYRRSGQIRREHAALTFLGTLRAYAAVAAHRVAYERAHPGLLPSP